MFPEHTEEKLDSETLGSNLFTHLSTHLPARLSIHSPTHPRNAYRGSPMSQALGIQMVSNTTLYPPGDMDIN